MMSCQKERLRADLAENKSENSKTLKISENQKTGKSENAGKNIRKLEHPKNPLKILENQQIENPTILEKTRKSENLEIKKNRKP